MQALRRMSLLLLPLVALIGAPTFASEFDTSHQASRTGASIPGSGNDWLLPGHATLANPVVLPVASPTITLSIGNNYNGSTPMAIGYHPGFNQYYGAMGGNPDYSGFVWSAGGSLIQTQTPINVDVRSVYYNPNTSAVETISYAAAFGSGGLYLMGLDGSGFYTGTNTNALSNLPGLASDQTVCAYDPSRNHLYSRSGTGTVNVVDRTTGLFLGTILLDLASAGFPTLLGETIGFDPDQDVLITVTSGFQRALVHKLDGTYVGASTLPPFAPTQDRFNMGYAKGQLFVFDLGTNAYHGYRVLAAGHTILASAGPHGTINPSGSVNVSDGGSQTFSITPDSLYQVANVLVDSVSVGQPTSYTFSNVTADHTIVASFAPANHAPDCLQAVACPTVLWPPNHQFSAVSICGVTDADGDAVTITVTSISQDEPLNSRGDGNTCPDAKIASGKGSVRAERSGTPGRPGNGRVYTVGFTASDGKSSGSGSVRVCVPFSQGHPTCVDDGPIYNSLGLCIGHESGVEAASLDVVSVSGGKAQLAFALPSDEHVDLSVFDLKGRRVATIENEQLPMGEYERTWDMGNLPSNVYFVRLRIGGVTLTKPVLRTR